MKNTHPGKYHLTKNKQHNDIRIVKSKSNGEMVNSLKRTLIIIFFNITIAASVIMSVGSKDVTSEEDYGVEIWRSKNCVACHSIYGLGGHIGPDLTNVYAKGGKEYIDQVLKTGLGNMPDLELTKIERKKLIKYLEHINNFGEYPPKSFTDNPFGKNNDVGTKTR